MRNLTTDDQPNIPLPSGGAGNGHIYARNSQFVLGSTWTPTAQSLLETRFGCSWTQAGKNPPSLGSGSALRISSGSRGCRPIPASRAGCRRSSSPATRIWDARRRTRSGSTRRSTTRRSTTRGWLARTRSRPAMSSSTSLTEVQDVNPLYGRDTYNGQFSRPAGAASNNLYNLADFMLGLRAQYALSNMLVANLRQNMHFAYLQDDWRVERHADAQPRPALRVRDAVLGEGQRPVELRSGHATRMVLATRRFDLRPRADQSGSQQLRPAPRLRLHDHAADGGARRLRHQLRALPPRRRRQRPADQRPAGRSTRSSTRRCRRAPTFRPTQQGYPAGLTDPSQFNPLAANITYMPRRLPLEPGAELVRLGAARAAGATCCSTSPTSATAPTTCCCSPTTTRRCRTTPRARIPLQERRPDPGVRRHHLRVQRRQVALQGAPGEVRLAREPRRDAAQLADPVGGEGQRRAVAREPERQLPGAAGLQQPRRRLRPVRLSPAVQQHDELRLGAAVRRRQALAARSPSPLVNALVGGWELAGINRLYAGEPVTLHLHARRDVQSSRASPQDFRGANNYRPNVTGDPMVPGDERTINNWFNRACVVAADRPEPAVRQRGAQHRPRAEILVSSTWSPSKRFAARRPGAVRVPHRGVQRAEQDELPRAERQPQRGRVRHHHLDLRSAPAAAGGQGAVVGRAMTVVVALALLAPPSETPILIAHRGASGHRPEHTLEALSPGGGDGRGLHRARSRLDEGRRAASRATRTRSARTTDVAERFPDRKRSKVIDGQSIAGWFSEDFTLAEIQTLRARERLAVPIPCLRRQVPDRDLRRSDRAGAAPRRGARPAGRRVSRDEASDLFPQHRPAARREAGRVAGEARMESRATLPYSFSRSSRRISASCTRRLQCR